MESPSLDNVSNILRILDTFNLTENGKANPIVSTEALHMFQRIMIGIWLSISIFGICTNFFNLRTYIKMGLEDSVTISFFVLSISDFNICCVALVELLAFLGYVFENDFHLWFYLPPVIIAFFCMCGKRIFITTTILITTFLAVQRCLCVVIPFHVRGMFTRFRTRIYLLVIFIFSVICYSLFISAHLVIEKHNGAWNATQLVVYTPPESGPYLFLMEVVIGIGLNIPCQVIVMVCLVVMGLTLRKSVRFRQSAMTAVLDNKQSANDDQLSEKATTKETQAIIQVALVSAMFIATNSPFLGYGITNILVPEFGIGKTYHNFYHLVHHIMFTVELLNSSLNFVIYYNYNSKFRSTFLSHKLCGKRVLDKK